MIHPQKELVNLNSRVQQIFVSVITKAHPNREKLHKLTKLISNEKESNDYKACRALVNSYFKLPFKSRTKEQFECLFGIRSYPWLLNQFILNLSQITITNTMIVETANNLKGNLRLYLSPPKDLLLESLLIPVTKELLSPRYDLDQDAPSFKDFVISWMKKANLEFGDMYNDFFMNLLLQLDQVTSSFGNIEAFSLKRSSLVGISITQTESYWMHSILERLSRDEILPPYPIGRGPQNRPMRELEEFTRSFNEIYPKRTKFYYRKEILKATIFQVCNEALSMFEQNQEAA